MKNPGVKQITNTKYHTRDICFMKNNSYHLIYFDFGFILFFISPIHDYRSSQGHGKSC